MIILVCVIKVIVVSCLLMGYLFDISIIELIEERVVVLIYWRIKVENVGIGFNVNKK